MEKTIPAHFIALSIWHQYQRPQCKILGGVSLAGRKHFFSFNFPISKGRIVMNFFFFQLRSLCGVHMENAIKCASLIFSVHHLG